MKIGIITFHWAANYGAVLQTFALQHYLQNLGHDVEIIDYRPQWAKDVKKIPRPSTFGSVISFADQLYKRHIFAKFRKRYLNLSPSPLTVPSDLSSAVEQYDLILTGSDQVFNPDIIALDGDPDPVYLLEFPKRHKKKSAYAASFGNSFLADRYHEYYQRALRDFDKIGIREKSGIQIINQLRIAPAFWTPDPTLLLKKYDFIHERSISDRKYIFKLLFQSTPQALQSLETIMEECNIMTVKQLTDLKSWILGTRGGIHPSPEKWVQLIQNAEFVITDSFHCTVFSILTHRPFIALALTNWGTDWCERIKSLLYRLGLSERFLSTYDQNVLTKVIRTPINWESVDAKIEDWRSEGIQFIKTLLA